MECQGCGHNYPNTLSCCPKCKRLSPKRGQRFSDSRLIEFPRRTRVQSKTETAQSQLPAWRVELNEKVRAIKARRTGQEAASQASLPEQPILNEPVSSSEQIIITQSDVRMPSRITSSRDERIVASEQSRQPSAQLRDSLAESRQTSTSQRTNNHIVEAALTRVRRASENASRASLPKIEPSRPIQSQAKSSFKVDREATARALEPASEISPSRSYSTAPLAEPSPSAGIDLGVKEAVVTRPLPATRATITATVTDETTIPYADPADEAEAAPILPIDELEPLDYLEAEVRKVDRALSKEFARKEGLPLSIHFATGIIDLFTIAVSSSPFLAMIIISNGSFAQDKTRIASAIVIAFISFFYLALTQSLCGKTFGMMLTNTHILDAQTLGPPSPVRALARSVGYFLAAAPVFLGFLWIAVSRKRRGWHDLVSGTIVARDY